MTDRYRLRIARDGRPPLELTRDIESVGAEQDAAGGEVPSLRIVLRNARGSLTEHFSPPPLGAAAGLEYAGHAVFAGRIQSVTLGAEIELEIES